MRRDRWLPSDDAVSPVVGTVLLVGIAVTVMGVLAVFVLGFVAGGGAPDADFMFSQDTGDNNVTITYTSNGALDADRITVLVDSDPACLAEGEWTGTIDPSDSVKVVDTDVDSTCSYQLTPGTVVRVVWNSPDSGTQRVLGEWAVFGS